jgi:hypothetical protein
MLAQQEQELTRPWKFGGVAESAAARVEGGRKLPDALIEHTRLRHRSTGRCHVRAPQPLGDRFGRRLDTRPILLPCARDLLEDVDEPGLPHFDAGGKYVPP